MNFYSFIFLFLFSIISIFVSFIYSNTHESSIQKAFLYIGINLTNNVNKNIETLKNIYRKKVYHALKKNIFLTDPGLKFQVKTYLQNAQFEKINRILNDLNIESLNSQYIKFIFRKLVQESLKDKNNQHYKSYLKIINELN